MTARTRELFALIPAALLVTAGYFALFFTGVVSPEVAVWIVAAFALLFPIWFFRYARSLWMGFDHYWDPTPGEKATRSGTATKGSAR